MSLAQLRPILLINVIINQSHLNYNCFQKLYKFTTEISFWSQVPQNSEVSLWKTIIHQLYIFNKSYSCVFRSAVQIVNVDIPVKNLILVCHFKSHSASGVWGLMKLINQKKYGLPRSKVIQNKKSVRCPPNKLWIQDQTHRYF